MCFNWETMALEEVKIPLPLGADLKFSPPPLEAAAQHSLASGAALPVRHAPYIPQS